MKCKNYMYICALLLPVWLSSCKDRFPPDAEEFFSFYADGEFSYYPQEEGSSFGGTWQTLKAGKSGATDYAIYAYNNRYYSHTNPTTLGAFSFRFNVNYIPEQDTVIIDGNAVTVDIYDLLMAGNSYTLEYPLTGKIIFTQRNQEKLAGTFEFDAYKLKQEDGEWQITDTVLHITKGRFAIIPSK